MENQVISEKVLAMFREYQSQPWVFVKPGGNFGDELICLGAEKLARRASLNYRNMSYSEFLSEDIDPGTIIYINGSGGFNTLWSQTPLKILGKALGTKNLVVICGPSSLKVDDEGMRDALFVILKNSLAKQFVFFVREDVSLNFLKGFKAPNMRIDVDHDTALNLTAQDFPDCQRQSRYVLYAIRKDKEAIFNRMCSITGAWLDPVLASGSFADWLNLHGKASMIITNRTHSAILGTILGKKVIMLPNSYHKNRSVWEYSLMSRGVEWRDQLEDTPWRKWLANNPLAQKLMNSYKYRNFLMNTYRLSGYRI